MDILSEMLIDTDEFWDDLKREFLSRRILVFNDGVNDRIIESLVMYILKWNVEDKDLPKKKRKPIWLVINSPGGDSIVGNALVDAIEYSKTPVYTVGLGSVASMAFCIFICGKKRYAFPNTTFLMHESEIKLANSMGKAKDTMLFCEKLERRSKENILSHTNITEEMYDANFNAEYYMYGDDQAKELGIVDYVIGIDCDIDAILHE